MSEGNKSFGPTDGHHTNSAPRAPWGRYTAQQATKPSRVSSAAGKVVKPYGQGSAKPRSQPTASSSNSSRKARTAKTSSPEPFSQEFIDRYDPLTQAKIYAWKRSIAAQPDIFNKAPKINHSNAVQIERQSKTTNTAAEKEARYAHLDPVNRTRHTIRQALGSSMSLQTGPEVVNLWCQRNGYPRSPSRPTGSILLEGDDAANFYLENDQVPLALLQRALVYQILQKVQDAINSSGYVDFDEITNEIAAIQRCQTHDLYARLHMIIYDIRKIAPPLNDESRRSFSKAKTSLEAIVTELDMLLNLDPPVDQWNNFLGRSEEAETFCVVELSQIKDNLHHVSKVFRQILETVHWTIAETSRIPQLKPDAGHGVHYYNLAKFSDERLPQMQDEAKHTADVVMGLVESLLRRLGDSTSVNPCPDELQLGTDFAKTKAVCQFIAQSLFPRYIWDLLRAFTDEYVKTYPLWSGNVGQFMQAWEPFHTTIDNVLGENFKKSLIHKPDAVALMDAHKAMQASWSMESLQTTNAAHGGVNDAIRDTEISGFSSKASTTHKRSAATGNLSGTGYMTSTSVGEDTSLPQEEQLPDYTDDEVA